MEYFAVLESASRNFGSMSLPGQAILVEAMGPKERLCFSALKDPDIVLHPPFPETCMFCVSNVNCGIFPPSVVVTCCECSENNCQLFCDSCEAALPAFFFELQEPLTK